MKNLSINLFAKTRNDAFAVVSQINACITTTPKASALNGHILNAQTASPTTVLLALDDCSKTDAVIALRDTFEIFAPFLISGCVRAYYKNINAESTVLSLPVNNPKETEELITKHKLKITIDDLQ